MAKVHPVEVAASCCPHDLLHVPCHGDGVRHGTLPPLGPRGRGPRSDDCGGGAGRGGGVAARAVKEDEDSGAKVDPGWRP